MSMLDQKRIEINKQNEIRWQERRLERRLIEWGRWRVKFLAQGLGFPSKSVTARYQEDGGILASSTRLPELAYDAEAEEMDRWVNVLWVYGKSCKIYEKYAEALTIRYTGEGDEKIRVKEAGLIYGTYRVNLRLAKTWLMGVMCRSQKLDS